MSREEKINAPVVRVRDDPTTDDVHLQIHLRLSLDQVAESEAEELKLRARRAPSNKELCRLACQIFDARRARDRMLDRKLFGEPAWDMLLALYCLPARGELLTVTALTYAAELPQTTGHRWQSILTEEGLIERGPHGVDARKQTVRLTANGRKLLDAYLTKLFYCDTPVPPHSDAPVE